MDVHLYLLLCFMSACTSTCLDSEVNPFKFCDRTEDSPQRRVMDEDYEHTIDAPPPLTGTFTNSFCYMGAFCCFSPCGGLFATFFYLLWLFSP